MKKYIIIKADTNDGDYITEKSEITDEQIELIKPVIEAIKNFKPYSYREDYPDWKHSNNYPTGDIKRNDEKSPEELYGEIEGFNTFDNFTPHGEYGIHTIESVEILVVQEEIKLL